MNEEIVRLKAEPTQLLTKKGKPDMRRKEFSTPETTAKRVACAKKAGLSKLVKKAARDSQAEYAARLFNPAMHLLARIESVMGSEKLSCGISREVTKLCNDYFGEVRPCFKEPR
jgi:hypothetical protein